MSPFRWYLAGMTCWFAGYGLQMVLFSWLVTVVLNQPPDRVGIAQMAVMAPSLAFMLLGGAVADRVDGRALLIRYQLVAVLPPLALTALIASGALGYSLLLAYGVVVGTLSALVIPARDALLTRVVASDLPRAVAVTNAVQYVAQFGGIAVAGAAGTVGAVPLLVGHAAVIALGAFTVTRLAPAPPEPFGASAQSRLAAMRDGLREAARSASIWPLIAVNFAIGVLYIGPFIVVIPVLVRDAHGGGSAELALVNAGFWGGMIVATMAQVRFGSVRRPGRAIMIALGAGALILAAMSLPVPLPGLAMLCAVWGIGAGITITQGRTIVQLTAPPSHRARILALFQLGFVGGGPLGALAMGYVAQFAGVGTATVYPAIAMLGVLLFLFARSPLWREEAAKESAAAPAV